MHGGGDFFALFEGIDNLTVGQSQSVRFSVTYNDRVNAMDFQAYQDEVQGFVERGNYHAAINIALSGLNACRRSGDQACIDQCLALIESVVQQLAGEFGSREYLEQK